MTFVDLGACTTCTLMGAPVPNVHIPIQIIVHPDSSKVYVQGSKSSKAAIIDTATDTVIVQLDCANGCHGSYIGPKRGGGHYVVMSAAYQDKMSIYDAELLTQGGGVRTNMNSLLTLQGATASPLPAGLTSISQAMGWAAATSRWQPAPPWT